MKKLSVIFAGTAISGSPRACSVCFSETRSTLWIPPPSKLPGSAKTTSMRWLAGSEVSLLRLMVTSAVMPFSATEISPWMTGMLDADPSDVSLARLQTTDPVTAVGA